MQYTDIFSQKKKMKKIIGKNLNVSVFFAQSIHCGYKLEPSRGVLTRTHNVCFESEIGKLGIPMQNAVCILRGYTFHGHVFLMAV